MTADLLRSRLAGREWIVTIEVVTPPPAEATARDRVLTLADAIRADARVAALALTDRTAALGADPVDFAADVAARSGTAPLVHVAGKGRDGDGIAATVRRAEGSGVRAVLLTGGDAMPGAPAGVDAVDMLRRARAAAPHVLRFAVVAPAPGRPVDDAWDRTAAKRDAGAEALVAQVTWDLATREVLAGWQSRLGIPLLGAVMLLTRGRLAFLAEHRITGIVAPPALRARVPTEGPREAIRRLALDLVLLRRLGYAGAHVSGLLSPERVTELLDETARLDGELGTRWRDGWREAAGIA